MPMVNEGTPHPSPLPSSDEGRGRRQTPRRPLRVLHEPRSSSAFAGLAPCLSVGGAIVRGMKLTLRLLLVTALFTSALVASAIPGRAVVKAVTGTASVTSASGVTKPLLKDAVLGQGDTISANDWHRKQEVLCLETGGPDNDVDLMVRSLVINEA